MPKEPETLVIGPLHPTEDGDQKDLFLGDNGEGSAFGLRSAFSLGPGRFGGYNLQAIYVHLRAMRENGKSLQINRSEQLCWVRKVGLHGLKFLSVQTADRRIVDVDIRLPFTSGLPDVVMAISVEEVLDVTDALAPGKTWRSREGSSVVKIAGVGAGLVEYGYAATWPATSKIPEQAFLDQFLPS